MLEFSFVDRRVADIAAMLGMQLGIPEMQPEGDPDHGLARYIELRHLGISLVVDADEVCRGVQLISSAKSASYKTFAGDLPRGLTFSSSRSEVRATLGQPVECREGGSMILSLEIMPWDWFERDGLKLHFEYTAVHDRILMVSILPLPPTS